MRSPLTDARIQFGTRALQCFLARDGTAENPIQRRALKPFVACNATRTRQQPQTEMLNSAPTNLTAQVFIYFLISLLFLY